MIHGDDSLRMTRELTRREGIFAGISSGAALQVALRVANDLERGNIVVLLADGGWKYLSTGLWTRPLDEVAAEISGKVMW
jgi:cysteine synthase B